MKTLLKVLGKLFGVAFMLTLAAGLLYVGGVKVQVPYLDKHTTVETVAAGNTTVTTIQTTKEQKELDLNDVTVKLIDNINN